MSRFLSLIAVAALATALNVPAQAPARKSAFDKAALEFYARHVWVIGSELKITVLDPKPSVELAGFRDVIVRVSNGSSTQDLKLLVSNDGSKIVQGSVYDINVNPFKKNYEQLRTEGHPSIGTPGAPVVIVAFSDLECPFCAVEAKMIREHLVQEYPTQVRYYFMDFPIDSIHPWAHPAAIAGRCVVRQEPAAYWDYQSWLFDHQDSVS